MSSFELLRRRLTPTYVLREVERVAKKLRRRVLRPDLRVAHLPAHGAPRGRALVSWILDGYLLGPGQEVPESHTHYWESLEVGKVWSRLGYDVDAIHWTNTSFDPSGNYDVLVDVRLNLERLGPRLGASCLKLQHAETAHHAFHNRAQERRLRRLEERRGFRIRPQKMIEANRAIEAADAGTTTGNAFTVGTYAHAGKDILTVPISAPRLFPSPETKDFEICRRRWLWFNSGGLVHKGLDLALDAFREMPDHELVVCGPVQAERDFERAYAHELYGLPNISTVGWVDVASEGFRTIVDGCVGVLSPSCSEGGGGSAITCLHAGLIPLVTVETSVDVGDWGFELGDDEVSTIQDAVREISGLSGDRLRELAMRSWNHARSRHTREGFSAGYRAAAERHLAWWEGRRKLEAAPP